MAATPEPPPALESSPSVALEADPTLEQFRVAQRLQFSRHDCGAALPAWDAYLRAAPTGALAPDARWNRTLCLVKLGRLAEARRELEAFAAGAEDGYRQNDARKLLAALPQAPAP